MSSTARKDQSYINDESIPSQIFPLIENYREKVLAISNGRGQSALIIDDFFGDAHTILKDTHLKEIARIRNENNVEIMKLKKNLEAKLMAQGFQKKDAIGSFDKSKSNLKAYEVKDVFADNEAERQRRLLCEENEILKKRVRAIETIANSGNLEKIKFMEGASWIANKALQEANKHNQKLDAFRSEFENRSYNCITDHQIKDVDGNKFLGLRDWSSEVLTKESEEVKVRFETMLENVNYNMAQA